MDLKEYHKICNVGAAVVISVPCLGDIAGTRAVVYEVYQIPGSSTKGVSLVSETGKDWGGFSKDDIREVLQWIGEVENVPECKSQRALWKARESGLLARPIEDLKAITPPPVYFNGIKKVGKDRP